MKDLEFVPEYEMKESKGGSVAKQQNSAIRNNP